MRKLFATTCTCALFLSLGSVQAARAFTGVSAEPIAARMSGDPGQVQSGIGYWRQRYDRAQYRKYRGNPGAQYELRQKRRNLCRNVPEMC